MKKDRPDPEKLLQQVTKEEKAAKRGKLKIYLGASPGVGKTYTMLQDAIAMRAQGLDVVVGIVETHGRKEVEPLLTKLEILPREIIQYHGKALEEFDLEAALKRTPALILIDEMAHTNPEGMRYAKRWQDINELLEHGIDVYATLNIQHVESLNDSVTQIIHAPVKETVPDNMIETADAIELVDIPPDELLKRLREGKIYIPQQAELAADHFFQKGNLIALRELALRLTAKHVSAEVLTYRQGRGIKYIWPTQEKIIVCVGPGPEALRLIRIACRIATSLNAEWIAVYVEVPSLQSSTLLQQSAIQHLRFAEQLGAQTRVLTGTDVIKGILQFAREQNVTQIMIWKHVRSRWKDMIFGSSADKLCQYSEEIDVYVVTKEVDLALKHQAELAYSHQPISWQSYALSALWVLGATLINLFLFSYVRSTDLMMTYLVIVTVIAFSGAIGPAFFASVMSVLFYDYLFVPPYFSFSMTDSQFFFSTFLMFIGMQVVSYLIVLTKQQANLARLVEKKTATLLMLTKQLISTRDVEKILEISARYLGEVFNSGVAILLPEGGRLQEKIKYKSVETFTDKDYSVAQWVYDDGKMAGLGTETLSEAKSLYVPLSALQKMIGVLRMRPHNAHLYTQDQLQMLEACANQIAVSLDVNHLQSR